MAERKSPDNLGRHGHEDGIPEAITDDAFSRPPDAIAQRERDAELGVALRRGFKAALARWAMQRTRRGTSDASRPQTTDEATHPWDGRRHFGEDYTFACAQAELGVVARLEWLPGREAQRVWMVLLTPDRVFVLPEMMLGGTRALIRSAASDRWRGAGLQLDCVVPHRQWTLRFEGRLACLPAYGPAVGERESVRCSVDLTFLHRSEPFVPGTDDDPELIARHLGSAAWDARLLRVLRRNQNRGYVQLGEFHGTVAVGERLTPLRAAGLRQHTWGVRDWGASDAGFQCFAAIDDGPWAWVQRARFPWLTLEGGFVLADRRNQPVRTLGVTQERQPGRGPSHVGVDLEHGNRRLSLEAERMSGLSVDMDGRGRLDLALVRLSGDHTGWGIWAGQRRTLRRRMLQTGGR